MTSLSPTKLSPEMDHYVSLRRSLSPIEQIVQLGFLSAILAVTVVYRRAFGAPVSGFNGVDKLRLALAVTIVLIRLLQSLSDRLSIATKISTLPLHYIDCFTDGYSQSLLTLFWIYDAAKSWLLQSDYGYLSQLMFVMELFLIALETLVWFTPSATKSKRHWRTYLESVRSDILLTKINPIIQDCYTSGRIEPDHLVEIYQEFDSAEASDRLESNISGVSDIRSFVTCLLYSFYPNLLKTLILEALKYQLYFLRAFLLKRLLQFIEQRYLGKEVALIDGVVLSFSLCVNDIIGKGFSAYENYIVQISANEISTALLTILYKKSQRLSRSSRETYAIGKILNYVKVDVRAITIGIRLSGDFILVPIQLLLCLYSLWRLVGSSMLGGLLLFGIMVPLKSKILELYMARFRLYRILRGRFTTAVSNLFSSIKLLKLQSLEDRMVSRLFQTRLEVVDPAARSKEAFNLLFELLWLIQPFLLSLTTFACYTYFQKRPLQADVIYPTLHLLVLLSIPVQKIPQLISATANAKVSLERVVDFLNCKELNLEVESNNSSNAIEIQGNFSWDSTSGKCILKEIDFTVAKGEFVCLFGRSGSGKTALLSAISGGLESMSTDSKVVVNGSMANVGQTPWLLNETIRDNILFGKIYDQEMYEKVLDVCQLTPDIERFSLGDNTVVGDMGHTLSGGQKARIALARAVYSEADIYLIDDVLSAVDNHVGKKLFTEVFSENGVLAGKTVVFATNNQLIRAHADRSYYIDNGKIIEDRALASGHSTTKHLASQDGSPVGNSESIKRHHDPYNPFQLHVEKYKQRPANESRKIRSEVYLRYFKAFSRTNRIIMGVLSTVAITLQLTTDLWLKKWTENEHQDGFHYLTGYAIIGFANECMNFVRGWFLLCNLGLEGANKIFIDMTLSLVGSKISFFDVTPRANVLQRYMTHLYNIEIALPKNLYQLLKNSSSASLSVLLIIYQSPSTIPILVIVASGFCYYNWVYIGAERELKNFGIITKTPLFTLLQETLDGAETIRTFRQTERFTRRSILDCNFEVGSSLLNLYVSEWLDLRLNLITSALTFLTSLFFVFRSGQGNISGGTVGLNLGYASTISVSFKQIVGAFSKLEGHFTAVERCFEYTDLEQEEDSDQLDVDYTWRPKGRIQFENYSGAYDGTAELALREISFSANEGEKLGVVGRTGAGKSSLILALFRMLPSTGGRITIGGTDISKMKLTTARKGLSIISQDTYILPGSIRFNLDPLDEYLDHELWDALKDVHLLATIKELPQGLQYEVSENGAKFSVGEKQLFCLARALLKKSDILILDEATASVDFETDKVIQEVVRKKAKNKTVITIAHRIDTILDSDKILGLDNGKVVEFDTPQSLLADPKSLLLGLVNAGSL